MATFVWDPAVRWPPPANISLGYDVVAPGGAALTNANDYVAPVSLAAPAEMDALDERVSTLEARTREEPKPETKKKALKSETEA
jgi:hypothetical protein